MQNILVTNLFRDWGEVQPSPRVASVNRLLGRLGLWTKLTPPRSTGDMTSVEQRINMYHLAQAVLDYDVPGDFVELGCYVGQSAALFQTILQNAGGGRVLHVYDSFEGLPPPVADDGDTNFRGGDMRTTEEALIANFERLGLPLPVIHKGWFEDTLPGGLPEQIAFAHLDGDFYSSIKTSLEHVYPRLAKGAACLIDDYCDPALFPAFDAFPGCKKACDEFFADKPEKVSVLFGGNYPEKKTSYGLHGYFRKL